LGYAILYKTLTTVDENLVRPNSVPYSPKRIPMKLPYSLSDDDLRNYADIHLQYEIDMLTWSGGILESLVEKKKANLLSQALYNGILNTFASHARNLIDFLYSRINNKDRRNDIIIQDYVDEEYVSIHLVPISPLLEETLIKASKQVAHLSMERISYEKDRKQKQWKCIEILAHIRHAFASIAPYIPDHKMSKKLRDELSASSVEVLIVDITTTNLPFGQHFGISFTFRGKGMSIIPTCPPDG
jgi:hypothetical protein